MINSHMGATAPEITVKVSDKQTMKFLLNHATAWTPLTIVNIMGTDVLATQGARASATMILTT